MRWDYLTQPSIEPVSYPDMKAQLRIDSDDERNLITAYIMAAREYAETETQLTLIQRQIKLTKYAAEPPFAWVPLPRGPVSAINSVVDGSNNTVSTSTYEYRRMGNQDFLYFFSITWPFSVTYTAGFGTAATDVPAIISTGIKLHVAHLWDNRSATGNRQQYNLPFGLDTIYGQYKPRGVIG